jgi:hypothetical protein
MKGAMLFIGLAVENALEGAVVYKNSPNLRNGKLNPKDFHKYAHDLKDVANKLDLELSLISDGYLIRLSMFVQWASRYKAPLRQVEYYKSQGELKMHHPSDFDQARQLIETLQELSDYSQENSWPHES